MLVPMGERDPRSETDEQLLRDLLAQHGLDPDHRPHVCELRPARDQRLAARVEQPRPVLKKQAWVGQSTQDKISCSLVVAPSSPEEPALLAGSLNLSFS